MKPRVLNITAQRPQSGVKAVLENFETAFDKDIVYDFLFFSDQETGEFDDKMRAHGRKVFVLPSLSANNMLIINSKINTFFEENLENYMIFHIHNPNAAFFVSNKIKKDPNKIIIGHSHATKYSDKKLNALRNSILINRKKQFTDFIACSTEAGEFITKGTKKKYKILKNAIEISKYSFNSKKRKEIRNQLDMGATYSMAVIGLFNDQKNQKFCLSIIEEIINQKIKDIKLYFIGEGPNLNFIKKQVKEKGLEEYIVFLGYKDNVFEILNGMDVLLMPSLYEGLPVIAVEALANGMPIILSDTITKDLESTRTTYCSLKSSNEWVTEVLRLKDENEEILAKRKNVAELINMGYDISEEQKKLVNYYKKLMERS